MLNKFFVFYAAIMLTMVLSVMFSLISAEIASISIAKQEKKLEQTEKLANRQIIKHSDEKNSIVSKASSSEVFKISTDKNTYVKNEMVKIVFSYLGAKRMVQSPNSGIIVKTRPDIGKNYEVAFIEHKEADEWIAVEPVKRCSSDCSKPCTVKSEINASIESYMWDQSINACKNGSIEKIDTPTGEYRISSAAWNENIKNYEMISSEVFNISSLTKK